MKEQISIEKRPVIVSGKLVYYIYSACNFLFENLDEFDFNALLNMRPLDLEIKKYGGKECKIKIKNKQKDKFCYLLYRIAEELHFSMDFRKEWLGYICRETGVSLSYCRSYNKRITKESKKYSKDLDNKAFIDAVNQVFENDRRK